MSSNNSSSNAAAAGDSNAQVRLEIRVTTEFLRETKVVMHDRIRKVRPPVFRDLNLVSQLLPRVCEEFVDNGLSMDASENRPSVSLPDEYFRFNSAETSTLLSLLLDTNDTRMTRLLNQVHIRAMLREDRYYQIVDDPALYFRSKCVDPPAFHNRVVLYLTTPAVLIYLKQTETLKLFSRVTARGVLPRTEKMIARRETRQSKRRQPQADFESVLTYEKKRTREFQPFFSVDAFQYATYVHCYEGDILRFQMDYLAVKRGYPDALPILMGIGWEPNCPSVLLYRRRYYQYMTPFLDWVDILRYQLKSQSTVSVIGFYQKLLDANTEQVDIDDLKYLGHTMLECVELRRLSKSNCPMASLHGMYAGRKVYRDKEPRGHSMFKNVFSQGAPVRPVIPHACSPLRRFLVHLNYYDRQNMVTLPQMLSLVDHMLAQDFFSMHPLCKTSTVRFEPLVFQIYDFVWSIRQGRLSERIYLRNEPWELIKTCEDGYAWYQRWDVFNCICLLFSVCQNAIQRDMDEQLVDRLIRLIVDVLRNAEYLETFMSYSYFDTYTGLSSAVNCVPNMTLGCLMRVLRTAPFHLTSHLSLSDMLDTFSGRFWRTEVAADEEMGGGGGGGFGDNSEGRPRSLHQISEFLMTRRRRSSIRQAPAGESSDSVSGMSAMGSAGAVVLFCRDYDKMPLVAPEDEAVASDDRMDASRRLDEERLHLADYKQKEIDFRYGQVFTDAYFMATGRPRIFYNENMSYRECKKMSMAPYAFRYD